jgi:hypothetical protein
MLHTETDTDRDTLIDNFFKNGIIECITCRTSDTPSIKIKSTIAFESNLIHLQKMFK